MRNIVSLTTVMIMTCAAAAVAQEAPNSQTLEGQMQRMQEGQPAVPGAWNDAPAGQSEAPAAMSAMPERKPMIQNEWPAEAVAPPATISQRMPVPSAGIDSAVGGAIPALPLEIRTVGDVRYITGGVGDEEMAQLAMVEKDYNVRMLFAGISGAYVSGAMVRVMNESGQILLTADGAGPYLYMSLQPGKYTVEVTAPEGGIKTASVSVPASGFIKPIMRFTE